MKTFFIYGYFLGLTLASPITRSQERKNSLKRIDNTENNGDHREKSADIQMYLHSAEIPKTYPTIQQSLNDTISGKQAKKDQSGVNKQTSHIEIRRNPIIKFQHKRDLSHLTQILPKKRTGGKKHRPNKIVQSHNVYNTSRKLHLNDMLKHKLEKASIIRQLQKRSVDYEDTPSDPYHSPDISYDWDSQEDVIENDGSQDLNESTGSSKTAEDFSSNIDPTDSSESDHTTSNESNNPTGSPESSNPVRPNESNSSNESSYNVESEDSIGDITNPVVLDEESDSLESAEPNIQNSTVTTSDTETTNGLSESKLSSESGSQDNSSQSNEPDESSKSSDSSDSSSNESGNTSDSNSSSHSIETTTYLDNSIDKSQSIEGTVITDVIEENEIHD